MAVQDVTPDPPHTARTLQLMARQPLDLEALRKELAKESVFIDTEQLRRDLQWREDVEEFADGAWAHVPTLADDIVLTCRPTQEELEIGVLDAESGIELWARLADEGFPYHAGGELRARWTPNAGPLPAGASSGLTGPDGWLAGCEPDQLIGLRLRDGAIALEPAELADGDEAWRTVEPLLTEAASAAREALHAYEDEGDPVPGAALDDVVLAVRRAHPDSFRTALLPLPDMLQGAGLEVWRGYVGMPGAPWYGEPPGLSEQARAAFRVWMIMLAAHRIGDTVPDADQLAAVAGGLNGDVLELAGAELARNPDRVPVAEAMQQAVSGPLSAVPLYLQAAAAEGRGDVARQSALLEAAVDAGPDLTCVSEDLAELCSVRGDAQSARRLYDRARVESTYPDYAVLRRFLGRADGEVGRNRPCPCGSGRKYKMCHGRDLRHPFPRRADWLWVKLVTYVLRPRQRDVAVGYAELLEDEDHAPVAVAFYDGLVHDLALFDGGLLFQFLAERGELLPDDERELAEAWLHVPRRLLEVVEVRPLRGLRCRDLLSGEELEILDATMPRQLQRLDLIYGRALPDGAGGLRVRDAPRPVSRMMRSRLVSLLRADASGEDIAAFFAPPRQLPVLQTSEGEDVVMCTARYDVDDPGAVWSHLAEQGLQETDDELTETVEVAGRGNVVRGTIHRRDDRIEVEANAIERLRRLQQLVLASAPDARLVEESTVPIERMLAEHAESGESPPGPPSSGIPPEVEQEVLAEAMRRHEETWPDIELPALEGRTPRQAASDPRLRPELEALLDDFAWAARRESTGPTMDLDRLRRELGLEPR